MPSPDVDATDGLVPGPDDRFVTATQAAEAFETTVPAITKICHPYGPVRSHKPKKNRLLVHAADLVVYMARKNQKRKKRDR